LRLKVLLHELSKIYKNAEKFYEDYADFLDLAEEAYITTRYLGKIQREKC